MGAFQIYVFIQPCVLASKSLDYNEVITHLVIFLNSWQVYCSKKKPPYEHHIHLHCSGILRNLSITLNHFWILSVSELVWPPHILFALCITTSEIIHFYQFFLDPQVWWSCGHRNLMESIFLWAMLMTTGKESACNTGDMGSIPESGRSPGEGNGNPLQYSCLENPMDRGAWWAAVHGVPKSRPQLSTCSCTRWSGVSASASCFWDTIFCSLVLPDQFAMTGGY